MTHWHDDHVAGISQIVEECASAEVVISDALRTEEFMTLAMLMGFATMPEGSGVDELASVFSIIHERRPKGARFGSPKFAAVDKLLYTNSFGSPPNQYQAAVTSLSPSDAAKIQSTLAFANLIPDPRIPSPRIASPSQNLASVALVIDVAQDRLLLGADLEATADPTLGWTAVVQSSNVAKPPSHAFKIPHHGSVSSHDDAIWNNLLVPSPFAVLTPFLKGPRPLPTQADINRIRQATPNAYATALPEIRRFRPRDNVVRQMLSDATTSVKDIRLGEGHVRFRKSVLDPAGQWQVELFGDATAIN